MNDKQKNTIFFEFRKQFELNKENDEKSYKLHTPKTIQKKIIKYVESTHKQPHKHMRSLVCIRILCEKFNRLVGNSVCLLDIFIILLVVLGGTSRNMHFS